jgi:RNA polymerase-binding protein DksA
MLPIAELRQTLAHRRLELLRRVARVEEDLQWLDTNVEPEIEEEGQEENIARLLTRLDDRGQAEIVEIDRALARIESGDYGRCEDCGEQISEARLRVLPAAPTCVDCAAKNDRSRV